MKHKIKSRAQQLAKNPIAKKALLSMKPDKSLWGFLGIIFFFILPEIIAFIWGANITEYAKTQLPLATFFVDEQYYKLLIMLFEEGGSWVNIGIGIVLLIWLFF
ncbi:MAG: hypothetical protein V2A75_06745 [Pseudomonadota bacterium]